MVESIRGIRTPCQEPDVEGAEPLGRPPDDANSAGRAARAAASDRYQAFVSNEAAHDPCYDFAAPHHDFDLCVHDTVANPVLFEKEDADADAVDSRDVRQGGLADCHFLASLAALASTPEGRALIRSAVVENRNDQGVVVSWTVTLHQPETHWLGRTTYRDVHVTVDGPYVIGHARARPENAQNEVWPLVLEKAYARYAGGYNKIGRGGSPAEAMAILTGHAATYLSFGWPSRWLRSYGADELRADLASGKLVVLNTKVGIGGEIGPAATPAERQASIAAHRLLPCHAYFATGVEDHDGKLFVKLGNPWGDEEPDLVPCDELTTWFSGVSTGPLR